MLSSEAKLRYVVGAGVLAISAVGAVAVLATRWALAGRSDSPALSLAQALVIILVILAVVLAWFAYASLHDDLERRRRVEAALRASEAKFAGILDIAADAIISVDERQQILHYNSGAERIFGWTAEEAIGRELSFLLPKRHRDNHAEHVAGFGRSGDRSRQMGARRAISGVRRDGSEFPAEASISKLVVASGEHIYTVLLRDISERRRRDESQRRLTHALAVLGETLDVAATERSIVDLPLGWLGDGAFLDVMTGGDALRRVPARPGDPALAAALGRVAERPLTLDSPSRVVDVLRHGRSELVGNVDAEWIEAHSADADELERMQALGARALLMLPLVAREHVLGVLTIFRSVHPRAFTEQDVLIAEELALRAAFALDNARLYETAQQATIARDHALGVVSHDLRNPISAIGMCARALLASTDDDDAERRELVRTIMDSTELTQRMIRDLLDVASIEVGRLAVERRHVAPRAVLDRADEMFRRDAADRGVVLEFSAASALPPMIGDEERLVQVLANLLGNALRFSERGGRVSVLAERHGEEIEFAVQDNGPGIPDGELGRIFERYWTVRRNAPKGGTGLGLAIARGIVEAHGGRLWAESTLGSGSTFRFTVPTA